MNIFRCNSFRLLLIFSGTIIFIAFQQFNWVDENLVDKHDERITAPCFLQLPDPWHSSVVSLFSNYSHDHSLPKLLPGTPLVTTFYDGILRIIEEKYSCKYRCFKLQNMERNEFMEWNEFLNETIISCEFIEVSCDEKNKEDEKKNSTTYRMVYAQAVKKKNLKITIRSENPYRPSVLMIVLDSVSHSTSKRRLSKTLRFLHENFNLIEFAGHSKVGLNSNPNAAAFLAGILAEASFGNRPDSASESEYRIQSKSIWNAFHRKGFVTYFSEDDIINQVFGTKEKVPGNHFLLPFWRYANHLGVKPSSSHRISLNYVHQFLKIYNNNSLFALNWLSDLSHHQVNDLDDDFFVEFFNKSQEYMANTFLILMADHGMRFGEIRSTEIGRMEDNLPLLSIALPERFRNRTDLLVNLKENSQILTNHFDIHVTLWDILTTDFKNFSKQLDWRKLTSAIRGKSLLRPINKVRTCKSIQTPLQFCPCEEPSETVYDRKLSKKLANHVIEGINKEIPLEKCEKIWLKSIKETEELYLHATDDSNVYRITMETEPNRAIFQILLRKNKRSNTINSIGQFDRINIYGNMSHCVDNWILARYCKCKK